ncbi:YbfB/YjiJ family MFS transporter [Oricola sp.]|uniref:YbfB/YjiJ family MFS transporter n=1 Tax=Oricola sp. TaxID=1979950 RepID=UPI003BAAC7F7
MRRLGASSLVPASMAIQNPSHRIALQGLLGFALAMGVGRFAYTPLLPLMRNDGLLDIGTSGVLASVHFAGYAAGAYLSGFRSLQRAWLLPVSLVAIAVSTLAMGLTVNLVAWFAARGAAGVCSAFSLVAISTMTIRSLDQSGRLDLSGWVFAGVGIGVFLTGLSVLFLESTGAGSRMVWTVLGVVALIGAVTVVSLQARTSQPREANSARHDAPERVAIAWSLVIPYFAAGLGYVIPATYLPAMAQALLPSPLVYGWGWPLFGAAAAFSTIAISSRYVRTPSRQIWLVSQVVMAIGVAIPALWQSMAGIVVSALCVGGTFMIITMIGLSEARRIGGVNDAGRHVAIMTLAFATGQIVGPAMASTIFDVTGDFDYTMLLASGLLLVSLLPMLATKQAP